MDLRPNCSKCKCALDSTNIRTLPSSGGGFICRTCLGVDNGTSDHLESGESGDLFLKKKYLCEDCGYTFERNSTFVVSNCPMCATSQVFEVVSENAEELVLN